MDYSRFKDPFIGVFCGAPRSGKSYCIKSMVYHCLKKKYMDYVVVICPTAGEGDEYYYVPEGYVHMEINRKKKKVEKDSPPEYEYPFLTGLVEQQRKNPKRKCWLILDNCFGKISLNHKQWKSLLTAYRYLRISILITSPHTNGFITPALKEVSTYAMIWQQDTKKSKKTVYENFFSTIEQSDMNAMMDRLGDYDFILVNKLERKPELRYKICRANEVPKFKIEYKQST